MMKIHRQRLKSSLAITTMVGCRNRCSYCPQDAFIRSYKKRSDITSMSLDTFIRCMETVPVSVAISFSGFSEPWLNPECTRMVLHAHHLGYRIRVNTTLIGMKPEDMSALKTVPFIKFVVHLPDDQNLTRIRVDRSYLDNLVRLLEEKPMNLTWKFHPSSSGADIHPQVSEILRKYRTEVKNFGLNNRAGTVVTGQEYHVANRGRILRECQDFHHNILLPNGDVALCHMDWSLKHVLGNLLTGTYAGLYTGKEFQELQKALLEPDADILCRQCEKDIVRRSLAEALIFRIGQKLSGKKDLY